ncbi:T9SS type A sorting domain-containing protein [uncultured Tenacibaculum sp.]|uniref:T9SS type A sorting domain-containing protein n=1 Tax=uncultured Tenacibaculum sp. TaxID=174713 RepID=UPI0026308CD6|nr:T9SS type A sorting domain-containing protein [uncultured Tenacibaculum sp.]
MKKNYFFLLLCVFSFLTISGQTNLVPNGNMESWDASDSNPTEWFRFSNGKWKKSSDAQNKTASLELEITTGQTQNFIFSPNIPFVKDTKYIGTFYYKLVSGTFSKVNFNLVHKPGSFPENLSTKEFTNFSTDKWTKGEFEFTATTSENIQVYIKTYGDVGSKILIDNVSVFDANSIVIIPDVNFKKALLNHSQKIDTNNDGEIQFSEANSFGPYLSTSSYGKADDEKIKDLTGIEYFTKITGLNCSGNKISNINLTNNKELYEIKLSSNNITNIDISKNLNLVHLSCNYNQISQIDVSKNTNLKRLDFTSNKLTQLDIKNNKLLEILNCNNNMLLGLDLINNKKLTELNCNKNKLTTLNLSSFNNLKKLDCDYNSITDLNISNSDQLTNINCIYNKLSNLDVTTCTSLNELIFYNNSITSIDLTNNIELTKLSCYNNQITELNVSKNINLLELGASGNSILSLDVSKNTKLKKLYCSSNKLTNIDVSKNPDLTILNCDHNKLNNLDLTNNTSLIQVRCAWNQIKSLNLSNSPDLTHLSSSYNELTELNIKNGANEKLYLMEAATNKLLCIQVDNPLNANSNSKWSKDHYATYSENCSSLSTEVINIPDSNFKKYLLNSTIINGNGDNEIQLLEAKSYPGSIYINNSHSNISEKIKDLTGIEAFEKMTSLDCSYNLLTALDLSKNTKLTFLSCKDNNLKELNIQNGNNASLSNLDTKYNSSLTCIQVDSKSEAEAKTNWEKDNIAIYSENCGATASIDKLFTNQLNIYPNPVINSLKITTQNNQIIKNISIFNTLGKKVLQTSKLNINTTSLNQGLYLIKIESTDNKIALKKFIKQ